MIFVKGKPTSLPGKISVILTGLFILLIGVFLLLVAFGVFDFDTGHAWDYVAAIAALTELAAFLLALIAVIGSKDKSSMTLLALSIGLAAMLFIIFHSKFIND